MNASAASKKRIEFQDVRFTLLVADSESFISEIVKLAEGSGGYFVVQTQDRLKLKVPVQNSDTVLAQIKPMGKFVEFDLNNRNLQPNMVRLSASLKAKEESLKDYLKVLKQTKKREDLVAIQVVINGLILEVERLKGELKLSEHQSRYAQIDISFRQRQRNVRLNRNTRSDFEWINEVNVGSLLEDYRD